MLGNKDVMDSNCIKGHQTCVDIFTSTKVIQATKRLIMKLFQKTKIQAT